MRHVEVWLTFWKRLGGGNGKSDVRRGTEGKRTERRRQEVKRFVFRNRAEELEFSLQGIEEIPQSFRDETAPSESDSGPWSPGGGGSAQRRTDVPEIRGLLCA